jgi:hypothetical protein
MKVDAGANYVYAGQRSQPSNTDDSASTLFSTALAAAQAGDSKADNGTKQVNFTSMTRQEMRDWVNTQIRNGEMSLDDSRPFMAMTMKMPVNGGFGGELAMEGDTVRYDFIQKARDGIQGALSRNDKVSLKMLESAISIMQDKQGQAISVDTRA